MASAGPYANLHLRIVGVILFFYLQHTTDVLQGAYNSGKPGNLREFVNYGKLREFIKFTHGIYQMCA